MDKIFLHGMKADTLIGVYGWERHQLQTVVLDLDIALPPQSGQGDDIAATVHYGEVCTRLREELAGCRFRLLETLAEHTAGWILAQFGAHSVRVRVVKAGILPDVREVGVEIERSIQAA